MRWYTLLATGGFGRYVPAPGTVASVLATLVVAGVPNALFTSITSLLCIIASIFGWVAIIRYLQEDSSITDPGEIIIDEWAGQWLALIPTQGNFLLMFVAFVLFRLLDIFKPGPIGQIDRLRPHALSAKAAVIIADDILAGGIAALGILLIQSF